jgi:ADP-ribose pyrophosphatase YjhB (NUDIX family)
MNYCSSCGADALSWEIPPDDNRHRYVCHHCDTIHYQNPKMVVGCLPIYDDKILLCRRAIEPRLGFWGLPAGYLEMGETLEEGALRETTEESGAQVELIRLHAVYNIPRISQIYFFFLARMTSPDLNIGPETQEARLFAPAEIPYEEMAFPSSVFAIRRYLQYKDQGFEGVHQSHWAH